MLNVVEQHEPVLFELDIKLLSTKLVAYHERLFSWHAKDTRRSFFVLPKTELNKFQFSYADRMTEYFGINQFQKACFDYSKIICTWDPKVDLFKSPKPCFLILKFKRSGDKLDATVIFRNRDLIRRMVPNLLAIQTLMRTAAVDKKLKLGILIDYSLNTFYKQEDYERWISLNKRSKNK